jgi:hypothetical protein
MLRRFLIHKLNHTSLLVDITEVGLPTEIYPPEGKRQSLPSLRFQSWRDAEQYLMGLGAKRASLKAAGKMDVAVLTIT